MSDKNLKYIALLFAVFINFNALNAESRILYAKLEPLETYEIKAATSGQVSISKKELEGRDITGKTLILQLDDRLDRELLALEKNNLKNMLAREESQRQIATLKESSAQDIESLKTKSRIQKESEKIAALNAKIAHLQTLEQLDSLRASIATRTDTIEKKSIYAQKGYLYKLHVNIGDYVSTGTLIATVMDISSAKITFFVSEKEARTIRDKAIFIDDKPSDAKITKLYKVADSEHISEYRVEAILPSVDIFSKLVKIEIKDK